MTPIDWAGWGLFGFIATVALTMIMAGAQMAGWSRMDIPLMLGTVVTPSADKARIGGLVMHVISGYAFALMYAVAFALLGRATWYTGAAFGLFHGAAALMLIVPALPAMHPRMASERAGPVLRTVLEPPGMFALNYGVRTPVVTLLAHLVYGALLGATLAPR